MTTYLLVHGGFTDSTYWGESAALLKEEGSRVLLAELPSTGTDPTALGGLAEDAAEVRRLLDEADGPTVLVGHSYGGMVITEVADHPAIEHSVYLSAFWPERGQTMLDVAADFPPMDVIVPTEDGSAMQVTPDVEVAHQGLCADLDPARVPQWHAELMLSSVGGAATPSSAPDREHPVTFVVLDQDRAIPRALQESMALRADRVEHLPTSHSPQLSDPAALARVLSRAAVAPARG